MAYIDEMQFASKQSLKLINLLTFISPQSKSSIYPSHFLAHFDYVPFSYIVVFIEQARELGEDVVTVLA